MNMTDTPAPLDFEKALAELETIVRQMEDGQLSLEQSLEAFEQGVRLTRQCQQALAQAEQRVQVLIEQDGQVQSREFQTNE